MPWVMAKERYLGVVGVVMLALIFVWGEGDCFEAAPPSPHALHLRGERVTAEPCLRHARLPAEEQGEGTEHDRIAEEFGDLLFVMANIARHLKIDPEACLRGANQKFIRRFGHIETRLAEKGSSPAQSSLEEMDKLWDEVRAMDKR